MKLAKRLEKEKKNATRVAKARRRRESMVVMPRGVRVVVESRAGIAVVEFHGSVLLFAAFHLSRGGG